MRRPPPELIYTSLDKTSGPKAVGSAHGEFRLVVEALDRPRRDGPLGAKPVQQQRAVPAQHARDLLHRRQAGAHRLGAPPIEELSGPGCRLVAPEELELLP